LRVGLGDGAEVEIRPFAGSHLGKDGAVLEKKNKKKETNAPWLLQAFILNRGEE
jgi:hypothetical protein